MKHRARLAWMLALVLLLAAASVESAQASQRRYFANTVLSWWPNSTDFSLFTKFVDESKEKGMNTISIDIPWSIARNDGTYDFTGFDMRLGYIISKGMDAFIKLNMSTAGGQRPNWLTDEMLMVGADGKIYKLPDGSVFPSLAHPAVRKKSLEFAGAVSRHIAGRVRPRASGEYPVAVVAPVFNPQMTIDYPSGGEVDYSAAAKKDFNSWATAAYKRLDVLNTRWKTGYKSWDDVSLVKAPPAARELYYAFTIKRIFDSTAAAVRRTNPRLAVGLQTRAGWEDPSGRSLMLARLGERADWLIVSDPPQANHAFAADFCRTCAPGKRIATEIDAPVHIDATNARYFNQGVRSYEHGASALIAANWDLANIRNNKSWPFLHDMGKLARIRASVPAADAALYLSVWDLINGVAKLSDYMSVYDRITASGKLPVDILTDPVIAANPAVLARYKDIYVPANWTIPAEIRVVLKRYASKLRVDQPLVAGTMDEFGGHQEPLVGTVANGK